MGSIVYGLESFSRINQIQVRKSLKNNSQDKKCHKSFARGSFVLVGFHLDPMIFS